MIRRLIILLLIVSSLFADTPINTNAYGIPFLVIAYAWIGIGTILLINLLLHFNIIKSLPLSEGKQMKLFFIGLIITYGIAFYFN
jgi:hypothetical protein